MTNAEMYEWAIDRIAAVLKFMGVPYEKNPAWEGYQLRFPWCVGDVVCHVHSYGSSVGMVETYQFPWDDGDVTMLCPEHAAAKIADLYFNEGNPKA